MGKTRTPAGKRAAEIGKDPLDTPMGQAEIGIRSGYVAAIGS